MATSNMTFSDWQQKTNASLMSAAEELLDKLEDTSDLLTEIDEKYILVSLKTLPRETRTQMPARHVI